MSKEYERIRQEIVKKYKPELQSLRAENKALKERIELLEKDSIELNKMRVDYVKLLMYCNLSKDDRDLVLSSLKLENQIKDFFDVYDDLSQNPIFRAIINDTHRLINGSVSFEEVLSGAESDGSGCDEDEID